MSQYGADNIKVLRGLEPVKKNPGMYTHIINPNHITQEVIDNSIDECIGGFASKINITIENKVIKVSDNGRGIPIDLHSEGKPAVEVIFTTLHSGGKFEKEDKDSAYRFSGGLHGVGVTVTNALSHYLKVNVFKEGKEYEIKFEDGALVNSLNVVGKCNKKNTGTTIEFKPNEKYFDDEKINSKMLKMLLKAKAILLKGVEINYENYDENEFKTWKFDNGINDYLKEFISEDKDVLYSGNFYFDKDFDKFSQGEGGEWGVIWSERIYSPEYESYVNLIPTPLGGSHENGLRNGIFNSLIEYVKENDLMPKKLTLTKEDVLKNVIVITSSRVLKPQFQGQTKDKLTTNSAIKLMEYCVKQDFSNWLHNNFNEAQFIVEKAIENAKERNKKNKKTTRKNLLNLTQPLPGKLADCDSEDANETELFIVEGDSAGGSAKQGRDKDKQAILPLKGKPSNSWDIDCDDSLSDDTIEMISSALNVKPHSIEEENDKILSDLRYNKVFIMCDADDDGHHIEVLLAGAFVKHFPLLVKNKHVFISQPPLFKIDVKTSKKGISDKIYVSNTERLNKEIEKLKKKGVLENKIQVGRFKGLGEMNPDQLWETTLNPKTRSSILLEVSDFGEKEEQDYKYLFDLLLSKKKVNSENRKNWISETINFGEI